MNHNGKVSNTELKSVLSCFGDKMTDEEINNIFRIAGIVQYSIDDIDYIKFISYWINNN